MEIRRTAVLKRYTIKFSSGGDIQAIFDEFEIAKQFAALADFLDSAA